MATVVGAVWVSFGAIATCPTARGALSLLRKYPGGKGANWVEIVSFDGGGG